MIPTTDRTKINRLNSKHSTEGRQNDLEGAADLVHMHELKEEPYDAAEDGFVFSNAEIDSFRSQRNRNHEPSLPGVTSTLTMRTKTKKCRVKGD